MVAICLPGDSHMQTHLAFGSALWGRCCIFTHSTGKETESQEVNASPWTRALAKRQVWDSRLAGAGWLVFSHCFSNKSWIYNRLHHQPPFLCPPSSSCPRFLKKCAGYRHQAWAWQHETAGPLKHFPSHFKGRKEHYTWAVSGSYVLQEAQAIAHLLLVSGLWPSLSWTFPFTAIRKARPLGLGQAHSCQVSQESGFFSVSPRLIEV